MGLLEIIWHALSVLQITISKSFGKIISYCKEFLITQIIVKRKIDF